MPASRGAARPRRPILRFDLESVCIDERPNVYKSPQLVLKPQLDLPPRRPYTGSRLRMPVWRHFLMVHVKDKADELVKLDLGSFKHSLAPIDPMVQHSVSCLPSQVSFVFRYTHGIDNSTRILRIKLRNTPDFDAVLSELKALDVDIGYEQDGQSGMLETSHPLYEHSVTQDAIAWPGLSPSAGLQQSSSSNTSLVTFSGAQGRHAQSSTSQSFVTAPYRPSSQPTGPYFGLETAQRPWSPGSVPSRPATTIGIPGILGEGIYKVSKLGSVSSTRPRVRRTPTILESHGPRLYTVSKHFDKTLSRGDIYFGRQSSAGWNTDSGLSKPLRLDSSRAAKTYNTGQPDVDHLPRQTAPPYAVDGVPEEAGELERLRQAHTFDDTSGLGGSTASASTTNIEENNHLPPVTFTGGRTESGSWQSEAMPNTLGFIHDAYSTGSHPVSVEDPAKQALRDDWILQIFQIQHEGLCEVSRIWDYFTEKGAVETASVENSEQVSNVLSKYEEEFGRLWDAIVSSTVGKMKGVQVGSPFFASWQTGLNRM